MSRDRVVGGFARAKSYSGRSSERAVKLAILSSQIFLLCKPYAIKRLLGGAGFVALLFRADEEWAAPLKTILSVKQLIGDRRFRQSNIQ